MRCSAAYAIPLMGEAAKEAIPALIAHLPEERNLDVCQVIATTLGDLGEAAIPALVRAIKEGQAPNAEALVMGLAQMGEKAVVAIAELLPQTEGRVCDMLVGVLMMLGPQAKPAVGVLTRMLDQTERQELAVTVAMAIFMCGRCAGEAIPALIRCVAVREPDDQAVPWAERSLWCMREQSLQAVRFAIENTDGEIKTRLERVLTGMEAPIMDGFSRLDKLQCDGLIELFVAIGELLENSDTRLNWADIAKAIAGKVIREEFEYPQTGLGQRNLQNKMAELGAKLKECKGKIVVLTAQGRNHPCTLTPDGKEFLREGQEYLRMKSSLRRQGRNGH